MGFPLHWAKIRAQQAEQETCKDGGNVPERPAPAVQKKRAAPKQKPPETKADKKYNRARYSQKFLTERKKALTCPTCGYVAPTPQSLGVHRKLKHGESKDKDSSR